MDLVDRLDRADREERVNVLLVDDQPERLAALEAMLGELGERLVTATSGEEALRRILEDDYAAILLDVRLPGLDGFRTAALVRDRELSRRTPIIFIVSQEIASQGATSQGSAGEETPDRHLTRGYALGAVDYVNRPLVPDIVRAKVAVFAELHRHRRRAVRQAERLREAELASERRRLSEVAERLVADDRRNRFFQLSIDLLCVTDYDGRLREVNPAWQRTLGFPIQELLGVPILELVHPEDRAATAAELRRLMASQGTGHGEARLRCLDGSYKWLWWTGASFPEEGLLYALARDVTDRKELEAQLRYASTHDALTGVYNRAFYEEELERLQKSRRFPISVVLVDVDRLKQVNDELGHAAGDELLRGTGVVLVSMFRGDDVVARIGGDEFGVVMAGADAAAAESALRRLRAGLEAYNAARETCLSFSVGVGTVSRGQPIAEALREADERLYRDKRRKKAVPRA